MTPLMSDNVPSIFNRVDHNLWNLSELPEKNVDKSVKIQTRNLYCTTKL